MTTARTRPCLRILLLLLAACSSTGKGGGTGGSRDAGVEGGTVGSGGLLGYGGSLDSGGVPSAGGAGLGVGGMAGSGGKPGTGGTSGATGSPGSGGVPGTGGVGLGGTGSGGIDAASSGGLATGVDAGEKGSGGSAGNQAGGSSGAGSAPMDGASQAIDADAYPALQIVQVQVLSGGDCTVPSVLTSMNRSSGTLDLALPDGSAPRYYLPVAVANNLDFSGSPPTTEMNNLTLTHFTVELSAPNVAWSSACPATFDTLAVNDLLAPRTTTGVSLNAIMPSHAQCLLPYMTGVPLLVTATIWANGRHGGTSITSPPFVYSIEVCTGCLQQGYSDPAFKPYQYPAATPLCSALTGVNPYSGDPCLPPGQDAQILCCALPSTTGGTPNDVVAVCPGVFTGTASTDASASSDR